MHDFGSALIPDFQEFYNLRFTEAVKTYDEIELYYLISGLPKASRFHGRQLGEKDKTGFGELENLLLDIRNEVASLRAFYAQANSKKNQAGDLAKVEPYDGIPGLDYMKRAQAESRISQLHEALISKNIKTI